VRRCRGIYRSAMTTGERRRPDVVLLAHGSPDPRHTRDIAALAHRVAVAAPHVVVHTAYLDHHPPRIADVADAVGDTGSGPIGLVPLLLTQAFHARVDIPAAARELGLRTGRSVVVSAALGPHPLLGSAVGELLDQRGENRAVVLLGGSSRTAAVDDLVAQLRSTLPPVRTYAFATLDDHLPIDAALTALGRAEGVVAVTGILADGVLRDRMVRACAQRGVGVAAGVLADTDAVTRLVLQRMAGLRESGWDAGGSPQL